MHGWRERLPHFSLALAAPSCPQGWELAGLGCRTQLDAGWWGETPPGLPCGLGWVRGCSPRRRQGAHLQGWRCPRRGAGLGAMNPRQVPAPGCWAGGCQQRGQREEGQRETPGCPPPGAEWGSPRLPQLLLVLQRHRDVVPQAQGHRCPLCLQPPRVWGGPRGPQAGEEEGRGQPPLRQPPALPVSPRPTHFQKPERKPAGGPRPPPLLHPLSLRLEAEQGQRWRARGHVGTLLPKVLPSLRTFHIRGTLAERSQHLPPLQPVGSPKPRGCSHLGCRRQRGGPRWVLVLSSPPLPQQRQPARGWRHPGPPGPGAAPPGERTGRRGPAPLM